MKRTYEKFARPVISSKPTTLNLQTRAFALTQSDSSQVNRNSENSLEQSPNPSSENLLEKLIANSSVSSERRIQRKSLYRLPIQAKLNIGEPKDKYEKEADATAAKVVQQINLSPQNQSIQRDESMESENQEFQMKPISKIQRQESREEEDREIQMKSLMQKYENFSSGEVSTDLESSIQSLKGSGQTLDNNLQEKMGQAMGADFSGVKVHTDSQSDQLNQSIQAKAFTTGQDVFFRQGEYNPSSQSGQELIAHELTHVIQQNTNTVRKKDISSISSDHHIQRVSKNKDANQYYSDVLAGQKITRDNAVFTATSNIAPGGGHTSIYIERLDELGNPRNLKIHLTYGGGGSGSDSGQQSSSVADSSSGSSSSSGGKSATDEKGVNIEIIDGYTARESVKKSWVVNSSQVEPAVNKAKELQAEQEKYSYTLFGVSPFKKKVMNCAKFGEIILKAAGIKASSGSVFKIPSSLTKGKNKGYENTLEKDIEEYQKKKEVLKQEKFELEKQKYAKPINQKNLPQLDDESASDEFDNSEAQDWLVTANRKVFALANDLPARKCNRAGKGNQLVTLEQGRKIMICEDLGDNEVLVDAGQPIIYCNVSLLLLFSSVVKD